MPASSWRPSRDPGAHRLVHPRGKRPPGAARHRSRDRRGGALLGDRARRARASRRCSARSTAWSRTSPAATCRAAWPSPVATRARTRPASWPTSVGVRRRKTRSPGSSPTRSRRSWRTAWSSSACRPTSCASAVEETLDLLGHRRAARPAAAHALGRTAATRRDRLGAHRAPPRPRARRADVGTRSDRRRRRARRRHAARARPRRHGVMAEHRLERVVQHADRVVLLPGDGTVDRTASAEDVLVHTPRRAAGRRARPARGLDAAAALGARRAPPRARPLREASAVTSAADPAAASRELGAGSRAQARVGSPCVYGRVVAVREVDLDLHGGEVVASMGRNGSGKSSLLWALQGSGARQAAGRRRRRDPSTLAVQARTLVGLVPQTPVRPALPRRPSRPSARQADAEHAPHPPGTCRGAARAARVRRSTADAHPRDLSEGQRLALVLARPARGGAAPCVLLDEPTRGLDYRCQGAARAASLARPRGRRPRRRHRDPRRGVRRAQLADRVVVLADGEVVADGPTADVIVASPAFAPQVAKILAPQPWLTVDAGRAAGARTERRRVSAVGERRSHRAAHGCGPRGRLGRRLRDVRAGRSVVTPGRRSAHGTTRRSSSARCCPACSRWCSRS